jgi:hypothetical protein
MATASPAAAGALLFFDPSGLDRLKLRLDRLGPDVDAGAIMVSWMRIIVEDNRRGVLAGLDKDGRAMEPVTYRPVGKAKGTTPAQRNVANARLRKSSFAGFGPHAAGLHNNLTSGEYRRLAGPPLAPRGASSRVITNLLTGYQRTAAATWEAYGYWNEVVSRAGVPFLMAHFTGAETGRGHRLKLKRRDLRGVRPEGVAVARTAAVNWALDRIRATA